MTVTRLTIPRARATVEPRSPRFAWIRVVAGAAPGSPGVAGDRGNAWAPDPPASAPGKNSPQNEPARQNGAERSRIGLRPKFARHRAANEQGRDDGKSGTRRRRMASPSKERDDPVAVQQRRAGRRGAERAMLRHQAPASRPARAANLPVVITQGPKGSPRWCQSRRLVRSWRHRVKTAEWCRGTRPAPVTAVAAARLDRRGCTPWTVLHRRRLHADSQVFEPAFGGYKFSTYATWWIRQAITRRSPIRRARSASRCI